MCLIVNSKYHDVLHWNSEPFIAQTDLLVYKQLRKTGFLFPRYFTPYQCYRIKFVKGIAKLDIPHVVQITIVDLKYAVTEGIHAFLNVHHPICTYFAIIPKGSSYYIGEKDDIVSDELLIFKNTKAYQKYIEQGHTIRPASEL